MKKPLSENEFKTQANYFLVNRIKGIINCGKGLYGLVPTNGDISFSVRVVTPQKDTRITIGRYPDMSLAEARKKAGQIKKEQKTRINPGFSSCLNCLLINKRVSYSLFSLL